MLWHSYLHERHWEFHGTLNHIFDSISLCFLLKQLVEPTLKFFFCIAELTDAYWAALIIYYSISGITAMHTTFSHCLLHSSCQQDTCMGPCQNTQTLENNPSFSIRWQNFATFTANIVWIMFLHFPEFFTLLLSSVFQLDFLRAGLSFSASQVAQVEYQGQTRYARTLEPKPFLDFYCCIGHRLELWYFLFA